MKRLLVFLIVLLIIFLFRGQITGYWVQFFGESKDNPMSLFTQERDRLYTELPDLEFSLAIEELNNFEKSIHSSLATLDKSNEDDRKKKNYRRNLVCELAVIYQKMAASYLSHGDENLYMNYTRKSQEQFVACAEIR